MAENQFALWGSLRRVQIGSREDRRIQRQRKAMASLSRTAIAAAASWTAIIDRAITDLAWTLGLTPAPGESRQEFAERVAYRLSQP